MTLAHRLRVALDRTPSDAIELLAGDAIHLRGTRPGVDAAVLVAVTDRPEPGLILTKRPDSMRKHPGQVAFPGGRVDEADADIEICRRINEVKSGKADLYDAEEVIARAKARIGS